MWAAVPTTRLDGRREAEMVRAFEEIPRDTGRVIFFPARRGRRGLVIVALSATAIVVLALLWEVSMPWIDRRLEARRARRERRRAGDPAPRTTPAASAAPSSARASC